MSDIQEPLEPKTEEEIGGVDRDPQETSEWLEAFEQLRVYHGEERARYIVRQLHQNALHNAVELPELVQTPYINSIPNEAVIEGLELHLQAFTSIRRKPVSLQQSGNSAGGARRQLHSERRCGLDRRRAPAWLFDDRRMEMSLRLRVTST